MSKLSSQSAKLADRLFGRLLCYSDDPTTPSGPRSFSKLDICSQPQTIKCQYSLVFDEDIKLTSWSYLKILENCCLDKWKLIHYFCVKFPFQVL